MLEKQSIPYAPVLVESMRSLGYSFESAIADLIDNSISASAKTINLVMVPSVQPTLMILDDGNGMSNLELEEAMRYGSRNPLEIRSENDLGRFGLGLKAASMSQCKELIVISKKYGQISCFSWNLDHIVSTGQWSLLQYNDDEIQQLPMSQRIIGQESGTMLLLRNFDRVEASTNNIMDTLTKYLDITIDHLELVFHRFLDDGLKIYVNNNLIQAKDPFLLNNKGTQYKREQSFSVNDVKITMKPYILPHISNLTKQDIRNVGGKDSLRNEQGFYVYRNRRLIIWGTWFRLERKDELNKLARVMVDIPNSLDYMWSIDIKKSSANLPDIIKKNLYSCVYESVLNSEKVHNYRGRKISIKQDMDYVWERISLREGYAYQINRNMPVLKVLKSSTSDTQMELVEDLLSIIEQSFPSSTIYLDVSKGELAATISDETQSSYDKVLDQLIEGEKNNMDMKMLLDMFICCEPYCLDSDLVEMLKKEREKYE